MKIIIVIWGGDVRVYWTGRVIRIEAIESLCGSKEPDPTVFNSVFYFGLFLNECVWGGFLYFIFELVKILFTIAVKVDPSMNSPRAVMHTSDRSG